MDKWLAAALQHLPGYIAHQLRQHDQPGCVVAIAQHGKLLGEWAFGHADRDRGEVLTPRHRFRVASHSKTFTAVALMQLREQGRCGLDDPVGRHVEGLHPELARATLAQLLTHTAGVVRDGADAGQWADRRPFLNEAELRAALAMAPVLPAGSRFKYSNHGYGLLGLVIEALTGEPYAAWVAREVVARAGLAETLPDAPVAQGTPLARGHGALWPLGRRVVIPGDNATQALASATGFLSTAADLVRFYGRLAPDAPRGLLSPTSRREMTRRHWPDPHSSLGRWYGLGTISGSLGGADAAWDWFGHTGGFQGSITRTVCVPAQGLSLSVLTNAADGLSHTWVDGLLHILRAHARHGGPTRRTAAWRGRWWSLWGAFDLMPLGDRVLLANPALANPLQDASEIEVAGPMRRGWAPGRIALSGGFASHGEPAALQFGPDGQPVALRLGGTVFKPEAEVMAELQARYPQTRYPQARSRKPRPPTA